MKYLKKAIPVDAWQIDMLEIDNDGAYPEWVKEAWDKKIIGYGQRKHSLQIITLEGAMTADEGDYLIKGPKGEFWFNKKHIFEEMYEEYNDKPIHWRGGQIDNVRFVENDDGSANIIMEMDSDVKDFFAAEGVRRVLRDAVEALSEKYESEKQ